MYKQHCTNKLQNNTTQAIHKVTTGHLHFSISIKHKKVNEIVDTWKQKGSYSDKICLAIIKQWDDENKGNKITAFNGQQSKLPQLPPVYEPLTQEDMEGLTYEERRTILFAVMESARIVRKSIEIDQKQR